MVAKIRPIMSSTYITLGSRTASPSVLYFTSIRFYFQLTPNLPYYFFEIIGYFDYFTYHTMTLRIR